MPHFIAPAHFDALIRRLSGQMPVVMLETQQNGDALVAAGARAILQCRDHTATFHKASGAITRKKQNPWHALHDFRSEWSGQWMFGYLGYDLKNGLERLHSANPDPVSAPDLWLMVPERVLRYAAGSGTLDVTEGPELPETWLAPPTNLCATADAFRFEIETGTETDRARYLDIIRQAQRAIFEGDYYEINLSRQLSGTYEGDPFALYAAMRARGPVPFGAWLAFGDFRVCCASPERFLKRAGNRLISEPIKGTAPVAASDAENAQIAAALLASEKNRAENLMVVDLVRHDFSAVCAAGSVQVPELFAIKKFGTVHQMISTVTGELRSGVSSVEALAACFPMGSMTGAPKISAMRDIEKLETYRRGIYSGAIGYISPEDDFDFNVVIRTAICRNGRLFYATGGAITADSEPAEEWDETLVKSRALTQAAVSATALQKR
ncbi:para-aminobenzoate synthetase component 1 [Cyclonatronum proteinivorum]|uniref:Para-aminobenzoate synthetase component 1 n=1 Tax=Cyclonatronum proteinivorum TaxID=1457365 RepID=A0A345UK16_9BACT|nr:chorismate-binding protein [Cyclonatronum proteinivorum]AXJ00818.1 para-aminobenzoate synthetase component 1 [Cyclonatronum proteinivorum]